MTRILRGVQPAKIQVRLPFYGSFNLAPGAAAFQDSYIAVNSPANVFNSLTTPLAARGWNEYTSSDAMSYILYEVKGFKYSVNIMPHGDTTSSETMVVGFYFSDLYAYYDNLSDIMELGNAAMTNFGLTYTTWAGSQTGNYGNTSNRFHKSGFIPVRKACKFLYSSPNPSQFVQAYNTGPTLPVCMTFFAGCADQSGTMQPVKVIFKVEYWVEFSEPVLPKASVGATGTYGATGANSGVNPEYGFTRNSILALDV